MRELNHIEVELSGTNLIEASAGTGKTYAISCLYLRLLLESDLTPEQILVVTYTEAATKELRDRIRRRIREAVAILNGASSDDNFLVALAAKFGSDPRSMAVAIDKLDVALKAFDTAAIFTIHGFCLRSLEDNSFESGSYYQTQLVTDQAALLQEVVDDFWRQRFFTPHAPLLPYALASKYSPDYFSKFAKEFVGNPKLNILPEFDPDAIINSDNKCNAWFKKIQSVWCDLHAEVTDILQNDKGLSRSKDNYKQLLIPNILQNIAAFVGGDNPFALFSDFEKITQPYIFAQQMKKNPPPEHEFFVLCGELQQEVENRFIALRWELINFCQQRLPQRKRELNIRCFDDLLNDLYFALNRDTGAVIAHNLRQKYQAALIDEFQDTDPVQYDIFRLIYADSNLPLFLIGDPKQAIYSFRGADIFAYLQAAASVDEEKRHTLTGNWRSTPKLLTALNALFSHGTNPFVYESISYHEISSGNKDNATAMCIDGEATVPLQFWSLSHSGGDGEITAGTANQLIPPAVAAEIAQLIAAGAHGSATIGGEPLLPGDIAIIVRSHFQASMMQVALQQAKIPSVLRSDKSLFATAEALEVFIVLQALVDPGNETKLRAALVTDIFGNNGNDIDRLLDSEPQWEEKLLAFRDYHQLWLKRGFMVMAQRLLQQEQVRGRLLRYVDGERRVTNLLHCFEVIHQFEQQSNAGLEGQATWFAERVCSQEKGDEYQIRLETDAKAVKIVTVHVSKGLEYPVVFCPYLWSGVHAGDEVVSCHVDEKIIKDFGSPDFGENKILANRESLAESLRLLYVAVTRAKYRCYLLGGKFSAKGKSSSSTSPLAYLLHGSAAVKTSSTDLVASLSAEVKALSATTVDEQLRELAKHSGGTVAVDPLPVAVSEKTLAAESSLALQLACRSFTGKIRNDWRVASFTSLAVHDSVYVEQPDRDVEQAATVQVKPDPAEDQDRKDIYTFPKGAQTGIFWHELFENLNFADISTAIIDAQVSDGLEKYGHAAAWQPVVAKMIKNVVMAKMDAASGSFALAELQPNSWIAEMEFFFPLNYITAEKLQSTLNKYSVECQAFDLDQLCAALKFTPVQGMVRGFIDMVFEHDGRYYLLDWKSNHLGHQPQDYSAPALKQAMQQNLYPLQYLLYSVALDRYLAQRIPDYSYANHFGGVFYLFLRGVDADAGGQPGIYYDLPSEELIAAFGEILLQTEMGTVND